MNKYEEANLCWWNDIADLHYDHYDLKALRAGGSLIDPIARREVGSVVGKKALHLHCHIGSDTLSWVRLGAEVTGVDFSAKSLAVARRLERECGLKARWIESDIETLPSKLDQKFDIVIAAQGILCWVSDLEKWLAVVAHFVKPGGVFYLQDGHPILDCFDRTEAIWTPRHSMLGGEPIECADGWDYTDSGFKSKFTHYEWVWPLSQVVTSTVNAGFRIEFLHEINKLYYRDTPSMVRDEDGYWSHPIYGDKLPFMFSLRAIRE